MKKRLFGLFSVIFALVLLVACGGKTFEVSFDLNGGTSAETIEVQKIKEGNLVTKPADPTRDGYTLVFRR
jgi:preprotein translocase subunit SecF